MSIIPFIVGDVLNDSWSHRLYDQQFGLGLRGDDIFEPITVPSLLHHRYYRPWRTTLAKLDQGKADNNKFEVSLDVQQFSPDEISVKAVDDNRIVVEGKHEEKKDAHGFISRQFSRWYALPEGYDGKNISSTLSSDGVLTISAPKLALEANANERTIPITQTGPVAKQAIDEKSKL